MADFSSIVQKTAQKYNVDPALINAVIQQESSGNPSAWNKGGGGQGAAGLMQVRAPALSDYNAANGTKYSMQDLLSPNIGADVGSWYLAQQLNKFNDPRKALSAYKEGAGSEQAQTGSSPYAQQVLGRLNMPQKQQQAASLPGIPVMQQSNAQGADPFSSLAVDGQNKAPVAAAGNDPFSSLPVEPKQASQSVAPQVAAQQPAANQPGIVESFVAGLGRGAQEAGLGAQKFIGHILASAGNQQTDITGNPVLPRAQGLMNAVSSLGNSLIGNANQGMQSGSAEIASYQKSHPIATGIGSFGGQVGITAPLVAMAPAAASLRGAMGIGAGTGVALGALNPNISDQNYWQQQAANVPLNAALGAATPLALSGVGAAARYAGRAIGSMVQPFTEVGQQQIAQNILARAARGGSTAIDNTQFVPGTSQTLAEATANPGIATLQRTVRDLNPAPFVAQEQQNAAARLGVLGELRGTSEDLAAARLARANDAADNYLSTNVGIPTSDTAYAALKKTPAFKKAFSSAQEMAQNNGVRSIETTVQNQANANLGGSAGAPQTYVSGRGLQWVKQSLDDQIDAAMRAGESGKASNILGVKDQLLQIMDNNIDGYAQARAQFANQSKPIDAMQFLQSLNLTDAQGNVTLAKVQNAISQIQKQQQKSGVNLAKSVTDDQINALQSIRDDLLRAGNTELGKTRGSATAQNFATQNMMQSVLPGKLGALAGQLPGGSVGAGLGSLIGFGAGGVPGAAIGAAAGGRAGSVLSALANTKNDAIVDNLTKMLLNPSLAATALNRTASGALPLAARPGIQSLLTPALINGGISVLGNGGGGQRR